MEIRKAKIVCDKFALSHFAMGFVLYFCTGKNFREEVARMFGRLCCWNYLKHHDNVRNSFVSENDHSTISFRLSRDTRRGESFVTSKATQRENKLKFLEKSIPFLKRGRSRDDFPGLELCGRRGVRQPSKLQLTPKININGDTLAHLWFLVLFHPDFHIYLRFISDWFPYLVHMSLDSLLNGWDTI